MKIFAIIDEETTLLTGILLYYEKEGTCVIELPEYLDEWTAPLLFTSYVKKKYIRFHGILVFVGEGKSDSQWTSEYQRYFGTS